MSKRQVAESTIHEKTLICTERAAKATNNIDSITPENVGAFASNKSALFDFFFFL